MVSMLEETWIERHHRKNWRRHLSAVLSSAKSRRRVTLTVDDLFAQLEKQNFKCYYTGKPLSLSSVGKDNVVSIDRLDSSKDYVEGNVVLTTWGVNRLKGTMSGEEFIKRCAPLAEFPDELILKLTEFLNSIPAEFLWILKKGDGFVEICKAVASNNQA